ncbi:regulatory protein MarR [Acidithiobacillus ferrivorans SS3]|uniref:MarR family transcriptional regulator n=2 Tax=Acidithiobacillus ferrivorans TaxID=160808 RepID=A0A1B9BXU8_9PROT|nr:MarR family transcriptional regulator [Acidithiobacillus ferrivorans]AEM47032.1 regulatory protein MarR [Acidithiobacillus ferrivorans SS3]OCB02541.1 MarR family transcriptional regulator [Acidithiobacillus ferrivorans]OFA15843.1 MarR family transcriptional regulator [Acidithiobacillus ferrivorans]
MMQPKIQHLQELKAEMLAVVRGERAVPTNVGGVAYESAGAVLRLLTSENRELLAAIDRTHPESVAALARQLHRAEPNVSRTLSKLEACGLVRLREGKGKTKIPEVLARRITVDIDVFGTHDRGSLA